MTEKDGQERPVPGRFSRLILFLSFVLLIAPSPAVSAETTSALTGVVRDVAGNPVEGAEVFVYGSPQVKRTADFVSPPSNKNGQFSVVLPSGTYWAVARLRKGARPFGPLMPGDKHSGEPTEVTFSKAAGAVDFTVADLKEAAALSRKKMREDTVTIRGRILDRHALPVKQAYALANRIGAVAEIPDYLSSWVDDEGRYTLYLPRGRYLLGTAAAFPPGPPSGSSRELTVERDMTDVDLVIKSGD